MAELISPRVLKGFRDFLPENEVLRRTLIARLECVFRDYGFAPIDTPALELSEILLGKGGGETEKQVYRFNDNGGRDIALRFDLTVPFARFAAMHRDAVPLPFKRYHIGKVWRGENTQKGRYREFTQCDFDTIGSSSAAADAEILLIMQAALTAAGAGNSTILINHRGVFNHFLEQKGVCGKLTDVLRAVDKIAKIGRDETGAILAELTNDKAAQSILSFIEITGGWDDALAAMTEMCGGPNAGLQRLDEISCFLRDSGVKNVFSLAPSITRGLDYYTGVVFETILNEIPSIGSVCSGGRYDNLTALYAKEPLSGVGASIGLDRLIAAEESLGRLPQQSPYAKCAIICVNEKHFGFYTKLASEFRAAGISCEAFNDQKKLTVQFMIAEKKGMRYVIIPSEEKSSEKKLTIRDITARKDTAELSFAEAVSLINGGGDKR
ncbi:MAG: histidine--tRNA ligase [Spirochaetaceae bacterium]|jgi:histidyl-tRNA synthetase|nr:histidine--tRNA ligase [Spirochaetaceae bacterium]